MARKVNTVLGPIDAKDLGKTLMHEHFFWTYPGSDANTLYPYNREEVVKICVERCKELTEHGVKTVVDFTANDMGRDVLMLKEVSEKTGINIIFPVGLLYDVHGGSAYWRNQLWVDKKGAYEEMYELFMEEVTNGVPGTGGIKPGYIKTAGGLNGLSEYEQLVFDTAARVAKETGALIMSHTEQGTYAPEIANFYTKEMGLNPKQICINHLCGRPDMQYQRDVLDTGVYGAFDRFGLQGWLGAQTDENRMATLLGLIGVGYIDQLFISTDTVMAWGGKPPKWSGLMAETYDISHNWKYLWPTLLEHGITEEQLNHMLVDNPRRFLGCEDWD